MMRFWIFLLALWAGAAFGQGKGVSTGDQAIFADLVSANQAEIEWGKLAASRASADPIKRFAQMMVDDHGKALAEAQKLAQSKGVTAPAVLNPEQKGIADNLSGLKGAAFDQAYAKQAGTEAHTKVLAKLRDARAKASDKDLVALIDKLIPKVEQHLQHVPTAH